MRQKHIKALAWAVKEAECWRGSMVGNSDTSQLEAFDKQIVVCKEALKELRREYRDCRGIHVAHVDLQREKNERTY